MACSDQELGAFSFAMFRRVLGFGVAEVGV